MESQFSEEKSVSRRRTFAKAIVREALRVRETEWRFATLKV